METLRKIIGDTLEELDGMDIDKVTEELIERLGLVTEESTRLGGEVRYMTGWMREE